MTYSITQGGKCAKHLCVINEKAQTVATTESGLVFDFSNTSYWSFTTRNHCIFKVDHACTFRTGHDCVFDTYSDCTFYTGSYCIFTTGHDCIFKVGENCALIRCDVKGVIKLPVNTTIKLNGCEESGYLVNTKEWVKQYMDNEEGLAIIMANDEYFNPLLDDDVLKLATKHLNHQYNEIIQKMRLTP